MVNYSILDKDLLEIIQNSNKDINYINKSLKRTLYLLLYCNYDENEPLHEKEIHMINNYQNKNEFNGLFKLILSGKFSLKEMCLEHTHF